MFKAADADTEGMKNSHNNQDLPADDVHPPAGQPGSTDAVSVTIEEMEGVPEPRLSGRPQKKHRTVMQSFNKHEGTLKEIGGICCGCPSLSQAEFSSMCCFFSNVLC